MPEDFQPQTSPTEFAPEPLPPTVKLDRSIPWFYRASPFAVSLVYLIFYFVVPRIRYNATGAVLLSTVLSLGLVIWLTAQCARSFQNQRMLTICTVISIIAVIPFRLMLAGIVRPMPPWTWMIYVPGLPDMLFIWFAAALGTLLSFILRGVNMIPPVATVMALVDMWTVLAGGPVQQIMQSDNPVAKAVTNTMTVRMAVTQARGADPMGGAVGFADFLFIAFFIAAITRFIPVPRVYSKTVLALIGILCIYMLVVLATGIGLPALVPMSIAMIAIHWRYFHYERSELFALLYSGLFITLILGAFWLARRRLDPVSPGTEEMSKPRAQFIRPTATS